jgi:hypothetical protein
VGDRNAPKTFIHSAFLDGDILLIIGHALQPDWARNLEPEWRGALIPVGQDRTVFDTVIEVWNVEEDILVAEGRVDPVMMGFTSANELFSI